MKTLSDVIEFVCSEIVLESGDAPICKVRVLRLQHINNFLRSQGFPKNDNDKFRLSIIPFIFQEANYDDILWFEQSANLAQLSSLFEIDCMVQNQGKNRKELTSSEWVGYMKNSDNNLKLFLQGQI